MKSIYSRYRKGIVKMRKERIKYSHAYVWISSSLCNYGYGICLREKQLAIAMDIPNEVNDKGEEIYNDVNGVPLGVVQHTIPMIPKVSLVKHYLYHINPKVYIFDNT